MVMFYRDRLFGHYGEGWRPEPVRRSGITGRGRGGGRGTARKVEVRKPTGYMAVEPSPRVCRQKLTLSPAHILALPAEIKLNIFTQLVGLGCKEVEADEYYESRARARRAWQDFDSDEARSVAGQSAAEIVTHNPKFICRCRRLRLALALASTSSAFYGVYKSYKQSLLRCILDKAIGHLPRQEANQALAFALMMRAALTDNDSDTPISPETAVSVIQTVFDNTFTLDPKVISFVLDSWYCLDHDDDLLFGCHSWGEGRRMLYYRSILRLCQKGWTLKTELGNETPFEREFNKLFQASESSRGNDYDLPDRFWLRKFEYTLNNFSSRGDRDGRKPLRDETYDVLHSVLFLECASSEDVHMWGKRRVEIPEEFLMEIPPILLFRIVFFGITPDIEERLCEYLNAEDARLGLQKRLQMLNKEEMAQAVKDGDLASPEDLALYDTDYDEYEDLEEEQESAEAADATKITKAKDAVDSTYGVTEGVGNLGL